MSSVRWVGGWDLPRKTRQVQATLALSGMVGYEGTHMSMLLDSGQCWWLWGA